MTIEKSIRLFFPDEILNMLEMYMQEIKIQPKQIVNLMRGNGSIGKEYIIDIDGGSEQNKKLNAFIDRIENLEKYF